MSLVEESSKYFLNVYKRTPVAISHGDGVWLFDDQGNQYLDLLAGIAVNALGYNHSAINKAIQTQLSRNLHLSNFFVQDIQVNLARKLLELTPFSKLFLTNSGTEAIEGLLKLIKKWGNSHKKSEIISFTGSFHGRSIGAVSITGQEKYRKNFSPLLANIKFTPFNDVDAFNKAISSDTCAVIFEGITGEGGIVEISQEMLQAIKHGKEKHDYLIITDEIQTGIGRTGTFYYCENFNFVPDAIASAKGLGGGLPLGAFLVKKELENVFDVGEHGTTYGGNPLACASGLAALTEISDPVFLEEVSVKGAYFRNKLKKLQKIFPDLIKDVRGKGLMIGVEVFHSGPELMQLAVEEGLLFNIAGGGRTLRFVPPLILGKKHIDMALEKLQKIMKRV